MWNILIAVKKHLSAGILFSMLAGLFFGYYFNAKPLSVFVLPLTILMVFPMMVNIDFNRLAQKGDRKILLLSQVVNFFAIPLLAYGIGSIFFKEQPYFFIGFMLMSVLPTSGMTIAWTGFTKGNINAALKITILGLLLSAILSPFILKLALGEGVVIPVVKIMTQILTVVFLPLILGRITRHALIKNMGADAYEQRWKNRFPLLSNVGVILIVFIATALKAKAIIQNPQMLLLIIAPIVLFYAVSFTFTTLLAHYLCKEQNKTALVYGTVMRNLSVALAIAMTAFNQGNTTIAFVIAVSYIFQVQFAALYVRVFNQLKQKRAYE